MVGGSQTRARSGKRKEREAVRQLFPSYSDDVDPAAGYGTLPSRSDRPGVRVNMISSVDGATSVGGVSGALGGRADQRLFMVLRSLADVVVVGAGTMRAEGYGPARLSEDLQHARVGRRQPPVPPMAVVTRSCTLDWQAPFFTEATVRPVVLTALSAPASRRERAAEVAEVVVAGDEDVDPHRALRELGSRGAKSVLVEGGPSLNAQLAAQGVLDELCLTVSPRLVAGDARRVLNGPVLVPPVAADLLGVYEEDAFLFLRYGIP
jgi:riboflavin biosynthesis pyrimidine reductase